jgi:hypothetical protein
MRDNQDSGASCVMRVLLCRRVRLQESAEPLVYSLLEPDRQKSRGSVFGLKMIEDRGRTHSEEGSASSGSLYPLTQRLPSRLPSPRSISPGSRLSEMFGWN